MDPRWGWPLAALAVAVAYWQWNWQGLILAGTLLVFWLMLQFSRSMRIMSQAAKAPVGRIGSVVMMQSKLRVGMTLLEILPVAGALGERVSDDPETFRWTDQGDASLTVVLIDGRIARWSMARADDGDLPNDKPNDGPNAGQGEVPPAAGHGRTDA